MTIKFKDIFTEEIAAQLEKLKINYTNVGLTHPEGYTSPLVKFFLPDTTLGSHEFNLIRKLPIAEWNS